MKNPTLPLLALLAAALQASTAAEPAAVLDVWPGEPPGKPLRVGPEFDTTKPTDRPVGGRTLLRLTNVPKPSLHVFLPPAERRNGTAVVICPGGAFRILAWDLEGTEVAAWLNSLGVTAAVLKYRVPTVDRDPRWLAPVQDAQRALRMVRSRATEWRLAPDRIGVMGFSAGGCTAAHVVVDHATPHYAAADAIDGVSCRPDFGILVYPAYLVDDKSLQLKPEFAVAKGLPPVFFVHAADDGILPDNSVQLFLALRRIGVGAELHVYEKGGHGYGLRPVPEFPVTFWPERCEAWLRSRNLLPAAAPRT